MKLTVLYDGQYWVGVLEDETHHQLRAARFIFGPEPKDEEVYAFVRDNRMLDVLSDVKSVVDAPKAQVRMSNPKRRLREAAREVQSRGISTLAQQALKLELESRKRERKVVTKEQRVALEEHKRALARQKAKAKHRGH